MSLPSEDHVSRYCRPSSVDQVSGLPSGAAFLRTVKNGVLEEYLSVNWLEKISIEAQYTQVEELKALFISKGYKLKSTGRFAILNVGKAIENAQSNGFEIDIFHDPSKSDDSHSSISNMPAEGDDIALAELIAMNVITTYPSL
jgi:hypothetical protein